MHCVVNANVYRRVRDSFCITQKSDWNSNCSFKTLGQEVDPYGHGWAGQRMRFVN